MTDSEPSPVTHVILTRFNLATPGRESSIRNQPGWLEDRFDLFERYCMPSVAGQTEQQFTWLVFFDDETPAAFRQRIERCQEVFPFKAIFTGLFQADGWIRGVRKTVGERPGWLLTTRLDNDDALAVDYCERLRAAATARPERRAFNFTNGFVLSGGRVYAHQHPSNAFASYLEAFDAEARTICATVQHMDLRGFVDVVQIDGPGAWLQVIHQRNVSNKVRGYRVSRAALTCRFPPGILAELCEDDYRLYLDNAALWPARRARDLAIDLLKRGLRRSAKQ